MIPTATQCIDFAAERLGNTEFDEPFTQTRLLARVNQAYRELYAKMQKHSLPGVQKTAYYNLPAYTNVFTPAKAGIADFGELLADGLSERSVAASFTVTAVEPTSGELTVTCGAHALSANAKVVAYGITGDAGANGEWFVAVPSSTKLTFNGSTATVSGSTASSGTVSTSTERFVPLVERDLEPYIDSVALTNESLGMFEWSGESFRFLGATSVRQLRIQYRRSAADLTLTESTGIDDCKNFLGIRAAALASYDFDRALAETLDAQAAESLDDLITHMAKALQRVVTRRPPFRHSMANRVHL